MSPIARPASTTAVTAAAIARPMSTSLVGGLLFGGVTRRAGTAVAVMSAIPHVGRCGLSCPEWTGRRNDLEDAGGRGLLRRTRPAASVLARPSPLLVDAHVNDRFARGRRCSPRMPCPDRPPAG